MKKAIVVSLIIFIISLGGGFYFWSNFWHKPYPEFKFVNLSGQKLTIGKNGNHLEIEGKKEPVLFYFLQPSCGTCFIGIEHIKRIKESYKGKIRFIPIIVSTDSARDFDEAKVINQTYDLGFDFYAPTDKNGFFESFERQTDSNLIVLYDENLDFVQEYEGIVPEEMIESDINQLLEKNGEKDVSKP